MKTAPQCKVVLVDSRNNQTQGHLILSNRGALTLPGCDNARVNNRVTGFSPLSTFVWYSAELSINS